MLHPLPEPVLPPAGPLVADVRRVAVLRANSIGDFVLALPALEALRSAYPSAEITVLGASWHPQLLDGRPGPWDRVVVIPPYRGLSGQVPEPASADARTASEFLDAQRAYRYDLAVQLHGGGTASNPLVAALGARVTAGARDVGATALDRTVAYRAHQHEVLRWLEVVGLVGAPPVTLQPRLAVTAEDRAAAEALLPVDGRGLVVVHAGANDPRRRWPVERFAQVATDLAARGFDVVLIGAGRDDAAAAGLIRRALGAGPGLVDLVDRASLSATLGVLERASLLVGNDSGPRHLAEAVGTPTVAVYWCGNLLTAGPLTRRRHRVLVSFRTRCPVCGAEQTAQRCADDPSFVADVGVGEVLADAVDLLAVDGS